MNRIFWFFILAVGFYACKKTIYPSLNTASAQIVIEGAVSDTVGPYYVNIMNSVGFYADNSYPGVSGAVITISDSTVGLVDSLVETGTVGMYVTQKIVQGIPGHTYLLSVLLQGKRYAATSTMPQPVALDSVTFDYSDTSQIQAVANYQDPKGIINNYKYGLVLNGVADKRFSTFQDRLSDGRYIRNKVDSDTGEIKRNYTVGLCLVGIDPKVETYLKEAENIAYSNSSLAAPATPTSNISGGCLGYFSAQTVSAKTGVVK